MQGEGFHRPRTPRPERRADDKRHRRECGTGSAPPTSNVIFAGRQALQAAVSVPCRENPFPSVFSPRLPGSRTPADRWEAGLGQDHGKRYHRLGIGTDWFLLTVSRQVIQKALEKPGMIHWDRTDEQELSEMETPLPCTMLIQGRTNLEGDR